jgi:hypothetical protein
MWHTSNGPGDAVTPRGPAHGGTSSMSTADPNGDSYYTAVPLEDEGAATAVEVVEGMVQLVIFGPVVTATATFTRAECRDVAYRLVEASQSIWEEGR